MKRAMKNLILLSLTLLLNGVLGRSPKCHEPQLSEDVDWARMSQLNVTWYDTIDLPRPETPVDCWNWVNFIKLDDGFRVTLNEWVRGGDELENPVTIHFIRVDGKPGFYRANPEDREHFYDITSEAIKHKADQEMLENLEWLIDIFFDIEIFFFTDYETYFIQGTCIPEFGLYAWIKIGMNKPTVEHVLLAWNSLVDNKIPGPLYLKKVCINRKYNRHGVK